MLMSLIMFAIIATLSPGGATTLATASGAQFGYVRSLPLVLGIAAALAILVSVSATGLSSAVIRFPILALSMKLVGSGYLVWLAFKIARAPAPGAKEYGSTVPISFFGGVLLLAVNPKAWAMAFGVAASFTSVSANPVQLSAIMAAVFGASAILSLSIWCVGGALLARVLRTRRHWRAFNMTLAGLLGLSILQLWS